MVTLAAATTATTSAAEACTSITSSARDTRLNTQPAAAPQLGGIGGHTRTPRCIQPICTAAPRLEQPLQQQPGARPRERRRCSAREATLQSHARTCTAITRRCSVQRARQAQGEQLRGRPLLQLLTQPPNAKRARVSNIVAAAPNACLRFIARKKTPIIASWPILPPAREMVSVVGKVRLGSCCLGGSAGGLRISGLLRSHSSEGSPPKQNDNE